MGSRLRLLLVAIAGVVVAAVLGLALAGSDPPNSYDVASGATGQPGVTTSGARRHRPPRSARIEIPDLVGLSFEQARQELADVGLGDLLRDRDRQACPGTESVGTVIDQIDPSRPEKRGRVVLVLAEAGVCTDRRAGVPCAPGQLTIKPGADEPDRTGSSGDRWIEVRISTVGEAPCQLRADATLRLTSLDGAELDVAGEPAQFRIDWPVPADRELLLDWYWTNLCPRERQVRVAIEIAEYTQTATTTRPPACEYPRQRSLLTGPGEPDSLATAASRAR